MNKLKLLSPEQIKCLSNEQLQIILNTHDNCEKKTEYEYFFDELTMHFNSIFKYQFKYVENGDTKSYIPIPMVNRDGDYDKFCADINKTLLEMTTLIMKNYTYLDKICIMFNPLKHSHEFKSIYSMKAAYMSSIRTITTATPFISNPYNIYDVFSMQLVDIENYQRDTQINLNNYIINVFEMNIESIINLDKFIGDYAKHCDYTKYCVPINITIPKSLPKCQQKPEMYPTHTIFAKIKFIDMVLLRKHIDFLGMKNKII